MLRVPVLGERQRWLTAEPVPRSRADRLRLAAGCLEDELDAECRGNSAYEAMREQRRLHDKRRLGPTKPYTPPPIPAGEVNVTDPDSRRMKGNRRYIQGYNAQAVVNEQQIAIAAEITTAAGDFSQLGPMIETALDELQHAGVTDKPSVVEVARAFFEACETGKAWEMCQQFCTPDATVSVQAEPLADVHTLEQYTDWMKGLLTIPPDGRYELKSFAADEEHNNVIASAVFAGTDTG
jgi:hypothetical protein